MKKNYLIVGGSSGIGLELVKIIGREEATIYVLSRTNEGLSGLPNVQHQYYDVKGDEFPTDFLPETIDGLVYCPGSINLKPFRSLKLEQFREDFEVNVLGAVKTIKAALKGLKKSEKASIVLFSTVAVAQGMPFHASIATAKAAVEGLTKSLAAELAPRIRVNCIAPSLTDTPLAAKLLSSDDKKEAAANRHPLKRIGRATDIANVAYFLMSQDNWISGQIIGVDGGLSSLRV